MPSLLRPALALALGITVTAGTSLAATGAAAAAAPGPIRINSGGDALIDAKGRSWLADTHVTGGRTARVQTVSSDSPEVDRSERYGAMRYSIPVSASTDYRLRLHLTEVVFGNVGQRVFSINAEGRSVAVRKDILADGQKLTTQVLDVPVRATDGRLDVSFTSHVNNASVTAIEVLPVTNSASGVPMPIGDQSGYRQVFTDGFSGTALDRTKWGRYSGEPGSDPGTRWDPSHVDVHDGVVTLANYRDPKRGNLWTGGAINNSRSNAMTAGKYEIRMRAEAGKGLNVVGLLWPAGGGWPPEIDFVEDRDGDRRDFAATLHYKNSSTRHGQIGASRNLDMTKWHTYGVEWKPGQVKYSVDGMVWKTVNSPFVPTIKMGLAVQTNSVTRGAVKADASTPSRSEVDIDWVVGYRPVS